MLTAIPKASNMTRAVVSGSDQFYIYGGFQAKNREFIDALKDNSQPQSCFADAVKTMEVAETDSGPGASAKRLIDNPTAKNKKETFHGCYQQACRLCQTLEVLCPWLELGARMQQIGFEWIELPVRPGFPASRTPSNVICPKPPKSWATTVFTSSTSPWICP